MLGGNSNKYMYDTSHVKNENFSTLCCLVSVCTLRALLVAFVSTFYVCRCLLLTSHCDMYVATFKALLTSEPKFCSVT